MAKNDNDLAFWLGKLGEFAQTVGGVSGVISFLRDIKPAAETVITEFAPGAAMSLKRAAQKGSKGSADDINFIKTLLALDGQNPKRQRKPVMNRITEYLTWLNAKDSSLAVIFVWVVGLEKDDKERWDFLQHLARIHDDKGCRRGDAANEARFAFTQNFEAFRKPEGIITKMLRDNPTFRQQWQKLRAFHRLDRMKYGVAAQDAEDSFHVTFGKIKDQFDPDKAEPTKKDRTGWKYWLKIWA